MTLHIGTSDQISREEANHCSSQGRVIIKGKKLTKKRKLWDNRQGKEMY
jgi:hypothetical protein